MSEQSLLIIFYGNPDYYPPTVNAIKILSQQYSVVVVCRNYKKQYICYPENVQVIRVGRFLAKEKSACQSPIKKMFQYYFFVATALQQAWKSRCELILAYDMHALFPTFLARWLIRKVKVIYHCHDLIEKSETSGFMKIIKLFELKFSKYADKVIFPNANRARKFYSEAKLSSMPLIVPNTHMLIEKYPPGVLRNKLDVAGYDSKEPLVIHQGIICNNQYSLNIVESIKEWDRGICVMIGEYEGGMKEKLERKIQEYQLQKKVFVLSYISFEELTSYTVDADIGLGLYRTRNINFKYYAQASSKINDYIAVGVPVLVQVTSDCKEVYGNEVWIKVVDAEEPSEIALAINTWLQDRDELNRAKSAARKKHLEDAHYELSFRPVNDFINGVLSA